MACEWPNGAAVVQPRPISWPAFFGQLCSMLMPLRRVLRPMTMHPRSYRTRLYLLSPGAEILSISCIVCFRPSRKRRVLLSSSLLAKLGHRRKALGIEPSRISSDECAVALVQWPISLSALAAAAYFLSIFGTYGATLDMPSH